MFTYLDIFWANMAIGAAAPPLDGSDRCFSTSDRTVMAKPLEDCLSRQKWTHLRNRGVQTSTMPQDVKVGRERENR